MTPDVAAALLDAVERTLATLPGNADMLRLRPDAAAVLAESAAEVVLPALAKATRQRDELAALHADPTAHVAQAERLLGEARETRWDGKEAGYDSDPPDYANLAGAAVHALLAVAQRAEGIAHLLDQLDNTARLLRDELVMRDSRR